MSRWRSEGGGSADASQVFDLPGAASLVAARQSALADVLKSLDSQMGLRTALDLGCGVGKFSAFLRDLGLQVVGVDGREENIREARRRAPGVEFHVADVEGAALAELGRFDLVLCFGLLYHLENPLQAIRNMRGLTEKLAVVESLVVPDGAPVLRLVDEGSEQNQSLRRLALYPTEACLEKMLFRCGYSRVYRVRRLPSHEEFRSSLWLARRRTMLVAATVPLVSPLLDARSDPPPDIRYDWFLWARGLRAPRKYAGLLERKLRRLSSGKRR